MEDFLKNLFESNGEYILYFLTLIILILCGVGLPIPEELTFLIAGFAGAKLNANVWVLCAAGLVGIMLGDSLPFYLGRKYGLGLLQRWPFSKILSEKNIKRTQGFFEKHGSKTVFIARFVAGLRMPTFFMAGTMGVKYRTFFFYDLVGALISCPTSIWLAYEYGEIVKDWIAQSHLYIFAFLGVLVAYIVYHVWSHRDKPPTGGAPGDAPSADAAKGNDLKGDARVKELADHVQ